MHKLMVLQQLFECQVVCLKIIFRLYFFTAAQIAQVAQPI